MIMNGVMLTGEETYRFKAKYKHQTANLEHCQTSVYHLAVDFFFFVGIPACHLADSKAYKIKKCKFSQTDSKQRLILQGYAMLQGARNKNTSKTNYTKTRAETRI